MNKQVYEVTIEDGTTIWRLNGMLHNEHGPAAIYPDGTVEYWQNDKLHNEHGPAFIYANGDVAYWLHGKLVTEAQVMKPLDGKLIEKDGVKYRLTAV